MDLSDLHQLLSETPGLTGSNINYTLVELMLADNIDKKLQDFIRNPGRAKDNPTFNLMDSISSVMDAREFYSGFLNLDMKLSKDMTFNMYRDVGVKVERMIPAAPVHLGKVDDFI